MKAPLVAPATAEERAHAEARLREGWRLSDAVFSQVTPARARETPIPLRNPYVFYLGHLPAFAANLAATQAPEMAALHPRFQLLFSRGIDPDVDQHARPAGSADAPPQSHPPAPVRWPDWADVRSFRDVVRAALLRALHLLSLPLVRLIVEHHLMHVETLYYMLAQAAHPTVPIPLAAPASLDVSKPVSPPTPDWISVPPGHVRLGLPPPAPHHASFRDFRWDNEAEAVSAFVPSFQISRHAVTVAQYHAFMCGGGYTDRQLWEPDDWLWLQNHAISHPASWRKVDAQYHVITAVGPGLPPPASSVPEWPVSVSLAEARAYARWVGADVPSETQWMHAAGDDTRVWSNSLAPSPAPVQDGAETWCGAVGMVGNGWELTSSVFQSFDGFQPNPVYPEYSHDFFDGKHFILKGASWATHPLLVRPSFRNFFQARYPYVFSKFRLVRPSDQSHS